MLAQHNECSKGHLQKHEGQPYECQDRCQEKQQVHSACPGTNLNAKDDANFDIPNALLNK